MQTAQNIPGEQIKTAYEKFLVLPLIAPYLRYYTESRNI